MTEKKMAKEIGSQPKRGGDGDYSSKPAGGGKLGGVGADMKGALHGNASEGNPLKGAMKELHAQHPKAHDDRGPHHGGKTHDRHEPMHGMHSKARHGR